MIALSVQSPSTKATNLLTVGASVPIGQRGIVTIWGRNDMATTQQMGIEWTIRDPDGEVVEHYGPAWEFGWTDPGDEHKFDGGRFDLDKTGTYSIAVDLLMNPSNPVIVDSYEGDLCTVTLEVPPEYELLQHTVFPYAYVYDGSTEFSIFTFKSDPFTPADWIADRLASALEAEVEKAGGRILEMRVYADKTPLFWTDWRIEVEGISPTTAGVALGIAWWPVAILAALAIAFIIVITWSITTIIESFTHKPLSPEIKATWSRGTLISTINDFEVKLERPPTPPEELEAMSDQELRDYCDQLAEAIVPPGISWLPLVIVGGLAVLGVGAAVALAVRRG